MSELAPITKLTDVTLVRIARELAMDIHPVEEILKTHGIDSKQWENIQEMPRFRALLETEMAQWNGALNTHERVKIKAAAMIEDWLPEAYERLHDKAETLPAKTELGKLVRDLAGFSKGGLNVEGGGEKFSVTINLGADSQLKFEKDVTPKVIDGEAA